MAAKMKWLRLGKKKKPFYRLVVTDRTAPNKGDVIEILGHYVPRKEKSLIHLEAEKVQGWLAKGALPTESVKKLLVTQGLAEYSEQEKAARTRRFAQSQARRAKKAEGSQPTAAQAEGTEAKAAPAATEQTEKTEVQA